MAESDRNPPLLAAHGGYRRLKSYQTAEIVYDATIRFCDRFVDRRSRTTDQMVQAARSGKQNIAEGSMASATSKKTELKLVSVARASLEELLLDYEDFLRQRRLSVWGKEHQLAEQVRKLAYRTDRSYETYRTYVEEASAEVAANTLLCLIHQANYLLDQHHGAAALSALEQRAPDLDHAALHEQIERYRQTGDKKYYRAIFRLLEQGGLP